MKSIYCMRCQKHTENKDAQATKYTNGRNAIKAKCGQCGCKKCVLVKGKLPKGQAKGHGLANRVDKIFDNL